MNKIITFLTLINLLSLSSAYLSQQEAVIYGKCKGYYGNKKLDCEDNEDCRSAYMETLNCVANEDTGCVKREKEQTLSQIIKCMNNCNKSSNEKVKSHFNENAQCLNHKQWPDQNFNQYSYCNSKYQHLDCGENGADGRECLSEFESVARCVVWNCDYLKQESTASMTECIRTCNTTENDTAQSFFSDYADCVAEGDEVYSTSGKILSFAILSFMILFMVL